MYNQIPSSAIARRTTLGRAGAAALLAVLVSAASAQTTPAAKDEPIKLEAFVSTGTRFNDRTVIQSPVPIDILTSKDLQQGGYTETAQMIQALVPSLSDGRGKLNEGMFAWSIWLVSL